jgi:hypothetical protein
MIRTVWLTIAGLAVLGALLAGKAVKTSVVLAAASSMSVTTIGSSSAQAPLTKADRLEFSFARQETPAQPALPPTTEPSISPVATIVPPVEPKIISRHWHDANATTSSVGKPKQPAPMAASKKAKPADPKVSPAAERSKPTAQLKPCKRTGPFSDFMRSLNLSPACVS